jgi:hypothetical protein
VREMIVREFLQQPIGLVILKWKTLLYGRRHHLSRILEKHASPILFINSGVDRMHAGREDYIKKLKEYNIYSEVKTFEGAPHSFCLFDPWFQPTVKYIDDFLKKLFVKKNYCLITKGLLNNPTLKAGVNENAKSLWALAHKKFFMITTDKK